ncbi:MAG: hypothetical protein DCC67_01295, partial [Planctomycetota bacterium]
MRRSRCAIVAIDVGIRAAACVALLWPATAAAALLGRWSFDRDYSDSSGHGHDFTLAGGSAPLVAGRFGQAVSLDGVSSRLVNQAGQLVAGQQSFTLGAHVLFRTPPAGAGEAAILGDVNHGGGIAYAADGRVRAFAGGASPYAASPAALSPGVWRHIVETFDASAQTTRLFIDGLPVATRTGVVNPASIDVLAMGQRGPGSPVLDGLVDEAFLFDEVLPDARVAALAQPQPAPARFWISRSAVDPAAGYVGPSGSLEVDLLRPASAAQGEYAAFHIWAQPGRDAAGFFKQLQNLSLNIVASDGSAAVVDVLDSVRLVNPRFDVDDQPGSDVSRFSMAYDSAYVDPLNPNLSLKTLSPDDIAALGLADGVYGLTATNQTTFGGSVGIGIGPWPLAGDASSAATPLGPAWRVASFTVRSLPLDGPTGFHLQIGARGMSHAGELTADAQVMFASPGQMGPVYRAGPAGDRQITLAGDLPEVVIRVSDEVVGDASGDNRVDGGDFLAWQRAVATTAPSPADADGNGAVDAADLAIVLANYGRPVL